MTRTLRQPHEPSPHVLRPFNAHEAVTIAVAAKLAGYSLPYMRRIAEQWSLGRLIGGGVVYRDDGTPKEKHGSWRVSRIALQFYLDGNGEALSAYHQGRHDHPSVRAAFATLGIPLGDGSRQRLIAAPAA